MHCRQSCKGCTQAQTLRASRLCKELSEGFMLLFKYAHAMRVLTASRAAILPLVSIHNVLIVLWPNSVGKGAFNPSPLFAVSA